MWDQITVPFNKPNGLKGHQILLFSEGFVLYGGATWTTTNLTEVDLITTSSSFQTESSLKYPTGIEFIRCLGFQHQELH